MVEGPTLVADAAVAGLLVRELFVEPGATERPEVAAAVRAALAAGAEGFELDRPLRGHTHVTSPNGLVAVVRRPAEAAPVPSAGALVLVLVAVADPGNVGTLVRVAEVSGAASVLCTAGSADPWSPKCVRSSAGSVFRVPVRARVDAAEALDELGRAGFRRVGSRAVDGVELDDADLTGSVALVLGNEAHGLPDDLRRHLDLDVTIAMAGRAESLNVAMAGAIVAHRAHSQRRSAGAA